MSEKAEVAELEIFIPAPGENPEDQGDLERNEFLEIAQKLLDEGLDIAVYSTDSYPSAFTECAPVAEQIDVCGFEVLPIMLVDGAIKVSFNYPDEEQLRRFSQARTVKQRKISAAAAACGSTGLAPNSGSTLPIQEPAGFAATLAGIKPKPVGGPEIGTRLNLMEKLPHPSDGSDFSSPEHLTAEQKRLEQELRRASSQTDGGGACGCGGCQCGSS